MNFDNEKAQLLHEAHSQKEHVVMEHERDMEQQREAHRNEMKALEARFKERQDKDTKVGHSLVLRSLAHGGNAPHCLPLY